MSRMGLNLRNRQLKQGGDGNEEMSKTMIENMREIPDECEFEKIQKNRLNKMFYIDPSLVIQEIFYTETPFDIEQL